MKDFRDLKVWHRAHAFALAVYRASSTFPKEEVYGLTRQIRRSSTSIPTNIAEGCDRSGDREFTRFLQIAMGSASEAEYQILLAKDLGFIDESSQSTLHGQVTEIKRMLSALLKTLKADR